MATSFSHFFQKKKRKKTLSATRTLGCELAFHFKHSYMTKELIEAITQLIKQNIIMFK